MSICDKLIIDFEPKDFIKENVERTLKGIYELQGLCSNPIFCKYQDLLLTSDDLRSQFSKYNVFYCVKKVKRT